MARPPQKSFVDYTALRVNQASIILLNVLAFVLNLPWLVAFVGLVMLVGTLYPKASLFKQFYARGTETRRLAQARSRSR